MASSRRNRRALAVAVLLTMLGACGTADYRNNWDTSSTRAGNAMMANTAIQEIEPWPPSAYQATVGAGG